MRQLRWLYISKPKHEIALINTKIISLDGNLYSGDALLIRGNRIACVGSGSQVYSSAVAGCEVIDMNQNFVYPGFVDAHCHVKGLGQSQEILTFDNVASLEEAVYLVSNQAKFQNKGTWILGRNWDQEKWDITDMPDKTLLDSEIVYNPVWLTRVDAHAGLANSMAIDLAKSLNVSIHFAPADFHYCMR